MRVLVLMNTSGNRVLVNTANIATVDELGDQNRMVCTTDGEKTYVTATMDQIQHAWRFGSGSANIEVFDVQV